MDKVSIFCIDSYSSLHTQFGLCYLSRLSHISAFRLVSPFPPSFYHLNLVYRLCELFHRIDFRTAHCAQTPAAPSPSLLDCHFWVGIGPRPLFWTLLTRSYLFMVTVHTFLFLVLGYNICLGRARDKRLYIFPLDSRLLGPQTPGSFAFYRTSPYTVYIT